MKKIIVIICYMALSYSLHAQVIPDLINSQGGSSSFGGGYLAYSVGEPVIGTSAGEATTLSQGFLQTWQSLSANRIAIKLFLEGLYYNNNQMKQAMGITGPQFGPGIADKIDVELHNESYPYTKEYEFKNLNLRTNGTIDFFTLPSGITGSYYLVIKHRNSMETWSVLPVDCGLTGPIIYDFSGSAGQAFGSNQRSMGGVYALWSGDVTQDGVVDGSDVAEADNANSMILKGYFPQDVNGDGVVDGSDMALFDNNNSAVVQLIRP
jgi:hypothetical protein